MRIEKRVPYIIIKRRGTIPFNAFYFNGLPIKKRATVFMTDEEKFSDRLFDFSYKSYSVFNTRKEAEEHIEFIKKMIKDNRNRYELSCKGSTEKLMKIANSLIVIEIEGEEKI